MKHRSVLFAALGASVILAAAAPAMADPDWGRHGYGDRGRGYAAEAADETTGCAFL